MVSILTFLNRLVSPQSDIEIADHQQEQQYRLRQLKAARDLRARQLILDEMMAEDLLQAADLSHIELHDVHLESANLQAANLCSRRCRKPT